MRARLAGAVAAALLLVAPAADGAQLAHGASSAPRACGDVADPDAPHGVRVAGVTCAAGRRVAEAHWLRSGRYDACAPRHRACTVRRFRCVRRTPGRVRGLVRCRRGARLVSFRYVS